MSAVEAMVWATEVRVTEEKKALPGFFPSPTAKYVAAALARRCWATGRVCWSQTGLARDTGMSPRTIWTALKALEEAEMLRREPVYVANLRKADRLIFTLRAVTLTLEPMTEGDFDEAGLANPAEPIPASQSLRSEPVATSAKRKPRTSQKKEATASSSSLAVASRRSTPKRFVVPDDWEPKDAHREKVEAFGWPDGMMQEQLERFREWEFKDGKTDFDRAFHRWLRIHNEDHKGRTNDDRYHFAGTGPAPRRGPTPRDERLGAMQRGAMAALDRRGR